MKILHIISQLPSKTGSGIYYSNMISEFKKYNYKQKAIYAQQDGYEWDILEKRDREPLEFKSEELRFPIVGMSDVMPYQSTVYSSMTQEMLDSYIESFKKVLIKTKQTFEPDIIFTHHLWILSSLVREIYPDTKVLGICHNTDLRQSQINPRLKSKYVNEIHRLDYILSISEQQKDKIVDQYGVDKSRIINVGGGFDQKIFYPPKEKTYSDKIRLVFCAKIDPSKGIYELIEVYKTLGLKDIRLDIIGNPDKENKSKLKRYIEDDSSIKLSNAVKQRELGDILRGKDIFIMPSYYEGVALAAIEALACGLYVVTTEIQALMSLLGPEINNSGIIKYIPLPRIYDVDKPVKEDLPIFKENLKEAILCQIEKVRKCQQDHIKMEQQIESFSWKNLVDNINDILIKIVV